MQKEHIKDIAELEKQCFSEPWSENALSEELSNICAVFFAAIVDNILAGYIGMHNICSQGLSLIHILRRLIYEKTHIGNNTVHCSDADCSSTYSIC